MVKQECSSRPLFKTTYPGLRRPTFVQTTYDVAHEQHRIPHVVHAYQRIVQHRVVTFLWHRVAINERNKLSEVGSGSGNHHFFSYSSSTTYHAYDDYKQFRLLMSTYDTRTGPPVNAPPGFRPTVLIKLIELI